MPSTSRSFSSASGEGQTKPVGTLFGLARNATKERASLARRPRGCGATKATRPRRTKAAATAASGSRSEFDLAMAF